MRSKIKGQDLIVLIEPKDVIDGVEYRGNTFKIVKTLSKSDLAKLKPQPAKKVPSFLE